MPTAGFHHVTAIARSPQKNIDFYCGILGLRLLKATVNFDDPSVYHFYFGARPEPGNALTFFAYENAAQGIAGVGQAVSLSFETGGLRHWQERLAAAAIDFHTGEEFGEPVLRLSDDNGLPLKIIETNRGGKELSRIGAVELWEPSASEFLTDFFGFRQVACEGGRTRYLSENGCRLDVGTARPRGRIAAGSFHHVAFRAFDEAEQLKYREQLLKRGFNVSPVMERDYFRSIYFREPGGVLFEIATDGPGFTIDEPEDSLGSSLKLPSWLESQRASIEKSLTPVSFHRGIERV